MPIPVFDGQIPPPNPLPDLVIESLSLDRRAYLADMQYVATVGLRNAGEAAASSYHARADVCRYRAGMSALTCANLETVIATGGTLGMGESEQITGGPASFASLPTDTAPSYSSEMLGIPNGGIVFVKVTVSLGPPGAAAPPEEADTANNHALVTAIFPSGPANPAYDPALDADGDGWYPPEDCNDGDVHVSPWSYEFAGNGIDEDCYAGDANPDSACAADVFFAQGGGCNPPGVWTSLAQGNADVDGDGYPAREDCDDHNSARSPGAVERDDEIDNNCNGLVDETFNVPDWNLAEFRLYRTWVNPTWGTADYNGAYVFSMPALRYDFVVANVGEPLGEGEDGLIDGLVLIQDLEGTVFGVGNNGIIRYTSFAYEGGYVPACDPVGLLALIPAGGLYGETNTANNALAGNTAPQIPQANVVTEGPFDRDLRFSSAPGINVYGPESMTLSHHSEAVGACPPLMDNVSSPDLPDVYLIGYRVFLEGELVQDLTEDQDYTAHLSEPDRLRRGDLVCLEVRLDPANYVFEVDETNNTYLQVFEYHDPLFGPPRFDLVDAYSDGPGTCASGEPVAGASSTSTSLTVGGAQVLGGIGGAILVGALGAAMAFYGLRLRPGAAPPLPLLGLAAIGGAVVGGWGGVTLTGRLAQTSAPSLIVQETAGPPLPARPSCDLLIDWSRASPADGETKRPGDALWIQVETQRLSEVRRTDRFLMSVVNPGGEQLIVPLPAPAESETSSTVDLVADAVRLAGPGFFLPGEYSWQILLGEVATDDATAPYAVTCWGSSVRRFSLVVEEGPEPSATPTPSPSPTATIAITPSALAPTRTPTAEPSPQTDQVGPSISKVNANPAAIYVTQPKGCTPNSALVSATITDPSGVQGASVVFFHTTIGQIPMAHTSGNIWTATLGPFTGTGDGTADYQIQAVDELGNSSDSPFSQVTVLACLP